MKIIIDTAAQTITQEENGTVETEPLYSTRGFEILAHSYMQVGWNQKYSYTFSWFGRPIIQLPDDILRAQEVIYRLQPDLIIETGVAHGGSLIFYASLCKAIGKGRVVGIDIQIRPSNRAAIEAHELGSYITLLEGSSVDPQILAQVQGLIQPGDKTLVFLDSDHSKAHVLAELEAYYQFVTPGSYIVATDGCMRDLHSVPRGKPDWTWDNPTEAAIEFAAKHPEFEIIQPAWQFNESELKENVTYWPLAWLKRLPD